MSSGTKRKLDEAMADAMTFRNEFHRCFDRWDIAGSIRRSKPEVGDVEHVIIPRVLNGTNLVWSRLESMLPEDGLFPKHGKIEKAVYVDKNNNRTHRWGPQYRGVMFNGFRHELFMADEQNWGAILAIRTGPAEFSKMMVTELQRHDLRMHEGYVRDGLEIVRCPDEDTFFRLCGVAYREPRVRQFPQVREGVKA